MGTLVVNADVRETLDTPHELAVRCGEVRAPSAVEPCATLSGCQFLALEIELRSSPRTVPLAIDEACEIELRSRLRFRSHSRQHKQAKSDNEHGHEIGTLHDAYATPLFLNAG